VSEGSYKGHFGGGINDEGRSMQMLASSLLTREGLPFGVEGKLLGLE